MRILYSSEGDLWIRAVTGGEARRLTNGAEDERDAEWSPDGKRIAFMSTRSGHQDVWVVDVAGGAPRQLTTKSMDMDETRFGLEWSPDGSSIVFVSNQGEWDHDDLWLVPVDSGAPRRLTTGLRVQQDPAFSPDGKWLAVSAYRHEEFWYGDMMDLYLVDAATGAERKLALPLVTAGPPVWSPDGRELLFSRADEGNLHLWRVGIDDEKHATKITYADGSINRYAYSGDGRWIAFVYSSPTRPSALAVIPPDGGDLRIVADVAPPLRGVRAPRDVAYRSFDGKFIHGFLYLPPDADQGGKWPALVQVHGGGTNLYRNGFNAIEQYFAQKGYIVLAINYRGSSGYGRGFQDLSTRDWGGGQAHDAAIAAAYLRSLPIATGKVGIYGYSYGGMMSMAAIVRHPDAFDAAVAMAGVYDPVLAYQGRDRLGRLFTELGHGGSPQTAPEIYQRTSAINKIAALKTPVLVMHGEADVRVPFNQFPAIVKALRSTTRCSPRSRTRVSHTDSVSSRTVLTCTPDASSGSRST
jgi:dipeptidyl aminopeptidase/acylaminoacyl peptidase